MIAVSALLGLQLLALFGISLASFQVGGGMLLLTSTSTLAKINAEEMQDAAARASIAVMPLTIPPLTCSATMSTMVIYADKPQILLQLGTLVGYGVAVAQATALCFRLAEPIAHARQDWHQYHDPAHGLDPGRLGRRGDARRALTKLFPALAG